MKISFPNCGSGALISIRAAINALLNWHRAERIQTAARKENVPQITPGWDYRPRKPIRPPAFSRQPKAETPETLTSTPAAVEAGNMIWFDFINPDRAIEDARTKAPLWGRAFTASGYDQGPIDNPTAIAEWWLRNKRKPAAIGKKA